jgi:hypothetical protein
MRKLNEGVNKIRNILDEGQGMVYGMNAVRNNYTSFTSGVHI